MIRAAIAVVVLVAACGQVPRDDHPKLLPLRDLAAIAAAGGAYVAGPDGKMIVPMSAVVTPPGAPLPLESPPFAPAEKLNDSGGLRLNLLPGLAAGRFTPYVTVELWLNDFGEIWVQPLYVFATRDANGATLPVPWGPVFGTDVDHRFYSPFWRIKQVLVTADDVKNFDLGKQPKSVKEILDRDDWVIEDVGLGLCPIVPKETTLDPALVAKRPENPGDPTPPRDLPAGVWGKVLQAEYEPEALASLLDVGRTIEGGWFEGRRVSWLGFGGGLFTVAPGEVVESTPIYMWVDRDAAGRAKPLGLPNIGAQVPPFSGKPVETPGGKSNAAALWDLVQVVRPPGSQPFFPGTPDFAALKADVKSRLAPTTNALDTSAEVDAIPGIERYAGRLARTPDCFRSTNPPSTAKAWATTCNFLDSQEEIEAHVARTAFIGTKIRVLCPIVLWSDAVRQ